MSKCSERNEVRLNAFFEALTTELSACPSVEVNSKIRLLQRMRKRAGFVIPDLDLKAKAKFKELNSKLDGFAPSLRQDIRDNASHFILVMIERYFTSLDDLNIQVDFDRRVVQEMWRFGPGASNGITGTHTATKLEDAFTCTELSEPHVLRLRRLSPYLHAFDGKNGRSGTRLICGSKLSTVPKNEDTVRTIATEPLGNMALQLAAGHVLEGVLRYVGCDISTQQPKNKALAHRGSIDGAVCTIDLSSASDMITPELVRQLLPDKWYRYLMEIRSPKTDIDGEWIELHMISTMGNGFTFPLMTLIICSLVYANRVCNHSGRNLWLDWSCTAVFGDDIIVPTDEYETLCEVLSSAGLVVNRDKSFASGPFRESCGGDYHLGIDVTPFYVRNLAYDSELYVAINQLLEWSGRTNFYPVDTLKLLVSWLSRAPFFVPEWCNPDQGIRTSLVPRSYKRLELSPKRVVYRGPFAMMLACGGYIEQGGSNLFYTPRTRRARYVVRSSRLPKGYLDGSDPLTRSGATRSHVDRLIHLIM
jgi:hypothetical protein